MGKGRWNTYGRRKDERCRSGRKGTGSSQQRRRSKLALQIAVCCLILGVVRAGGIGTEGEGGEGQWFPQGDAGEAVRETMAKVMDYGARDHSTSEVVGTVSRGISSGMDAILTVSGSELKLSYPCNEIETMTLAADSSSKVYSFSTDEEELQVFASGGGTVTEAIDGRIVVSHGNGLETVYEGCSSIYVQRLQKIRRGELIGTVAAGEDKQPELRFQILKEQEAVDIGEYF